MVTNTLGLRDRGYRWAMNGVQNQKTKKPSFPRASVPSKCLIWLVARARFELATWVMSLELLLCIRIGHQRIRSAPIVDGNTGLEKTEPKQPLTPTPKNQHLTTIER